MNLTLTRVEWRSDGIFSVLTDENGNTIAHCLEHAYDDGNGSWIPKVAAGTYTCVRHPPNRFPYETFMLLGVPDFQGQPVVGILLHRGNWDFDSEGCILLGQAETDSAKGRMVTASEVTFNTFMALQSGLDQFTLTVS